MPTQNSRTVRVFLSSTFRDFARERDLLVRKVFPELRRRCRERQVELVDVDLRWGITEEEAQQGKVLPICLAEIDRSRPYFMGFLGERYGWVPEAGQYDRSLLLEQPWLEEHRGGKSVTELEILHGVLDNPEMEKRAFFYFRDPAWSEAQGGAYLAEGTDEKAKLEELKERIRRSGFPVVENYASPEELAERVREDLWQLIDEAYPESEVPDALTRERMTHEAYGASRLGLYLGGEPYFAALDAAMAAETFRPVLVRGQSGGGKSALLANWVGGWSERHPGTAIIVHHLGCGADAADPVRMVVRLMREISRLTGDEFKPESDPEKQLEELPQWLALASAWAQRSGRELLLVLDGLDKVSAFAHLRWFPGFLPPGVKLVASCLDGEILAAAQARLEWAELVVEPFTPPEQTTFIKNYLGRYRKALTEGQRRTLLAHPLSGNPLFLLTVLEELRVFGVHEQLESRLHALLSPPPGKAPDEAPTVDDVFEHVLARIEEDLGRAGVQSAMESIWASRGGLYQDEVLAIAGIAPATWAGMANALDEALYESGGRIQFAHDYLRKAVEDRYGLTGEEKRLRHRLLAEWFATREVDERVASELPWQWREAEAREELVACLVDKKIFEHEVQRDEYELLGYWLWTGEDLEAAYEVAWSGWVGEVDVEEITPLAGNLGPFLRTAGFFGEITETLYRRALEGYENALGPEHPESLGSLNNLGNLLSDKGDYDGAEALYRRALYSYEKALGLDHTDTLSTANNLGTTLFEKGDYQKTNTINSPTVEIEMIGPELPGMLNSVKAELLTRSVFVRREKLLGLEHPKTLSSACSLGTLLKQKGDYDGAEALYRRALDGYEKALGSEHPDTLMCVNNIGLLLSNKSDYEGAEPLLRRALEGYQKKLGPRHPRTINAIEALGMLNYKKGDLDSAMVTFQDTLKLKRKALGKDHPDVLRSYSRLGSLHEERGIRNRAIRFFLRELLGNERSFGKTHPSTLGSFIKIGNLLLEERSFLRAEKLYRRSYQDLKNTLGIEHPNTIDSIVKLGLIFIELGNHGSAEEFLRLSIDLQIKLHGSECPQTLGSVNHLAFLLNATDRRPEAIALLRRFAALSDDSRDAVAYNLACYECLEGNHEEAKRLIAEHLARHPEKKAQALADEDFAAIRDWIEATA
jgi:nephrocystin-3